MIDNTPRLYLIIKGSVFYAVGMTINCPLMSWLGLYAAERLKKHTCRRVISLLFVIFTGGRGGVPEKRENKKQVLSSMYEKKLAFDKRFFLLYYRDTPKKPPVVFYPAAFALPGLWITCRY